MITFRKLFEELSEFERKIVSIENQIYVCKDVNKKLKLQHQLEQLMYQKVNKK